MRSRWGAQVAFAAAGAAIFLLAWWLRNPLIPYDDDTARASDFSGDSARADPSADRRRIAIRSLAVAVAESQTRLAQIARAALDAPPAADAAFDYLKQLPDAPEQGVVLLERGIPFAWSGQIRNPLSREGQGSAVHALPFYSSLEVSLEKGNRRATATALIHAEPPADEVGNALDERLDTRHLVESFRVAPLTDSSGGEIVTGATGRPLLRADASPLAPEALRFRSAATARARGAVLLALGILLFIAVGWSERRSLARRLFTIVVALTAIAIIPWNNFSNFSRAFNPVYYYLSAGGPFTANAAVFAMAGALTVLAVIAIVRARRVEVNRSLAAIGAVVLLVAGVLVADSSARGIVLPLWGFTIALWLTWEIPIFLMLFAFGMAAVWLASIAAGRHAIVQLRTATVIAVVAGAAACFIVWNSTTEQRLQLAMRDVAGLQAPDADAPLLLSRFGEELLSYQTRGTRADLLKRFAVSNIAPAELQASLGIWNDDGSFASSLDLAPLPFDSAELQAVVQEALSSRQVLIKQVLGPTGRQVMMAVPHRVGGATSVVASPRTRLIAQDPYAALLGFEQPDQTDPPYTLTLTDVVPGTAAAPGTMTWRRIGNEWHGDEIIATSRGPARAHVEVDIRAWPTRLVRASLVVILNIGVVGMLWALGAMAEGGFFRWLRGRLSRWARSYRGRLTLALFTFFVVPAVAFATWSYQRLRFDDRDVRELLVRETLHAAAGEDPVAPELYHTAGETPLFLYSNAVLTTSSDSLYEMIAPAGRLLPPSVQRSIGDGGELTASWQQTISNSKVFWGFRAASSPMRQRYVLAAPARSDELVLDRRRRDLTLLVLFATAVGGIAAFWLSGIAARILARDLELSRVEVARAERVLAWGEMARQIAHEIKNPLTPIRLGVQHLRRARADSRIDFDRVLDENVTRILSEIDRLDEIARSFSRYGSAPGELPPAEEVDVAAILRDVIALERMGIGDVSWTLEGADQPLMAHARADELRDVLLNVFENARLARARNVHVGLARRERTAVIEVLDDGAGIPRATLPRVFEPHFSTRTRGSGLGLAISRRLIESWGGTIDIASDEGNGARVVLTLRTVQG